MFFPTVRSSASSIIGVGIKGNESAYENGYSLVPGTELMYVALVAQYTKTHSV